MDFEEQLEKAEKSPYPSLVGASVKSADDSPHNNYIHPEKYTGTSRRKPGRKSALNSSIGASLDDLISEGALLGSDENFDRFLDDKGNVLSDAKYSKEKSSEKYSDTSADAHKPFKNSSLRKDVVGAAVQEEDAAVLSPITSDTSENPRPLSELENYSTPNLSEYQIGNQISDHSELLNSVKSHDLSKLPTAEHTESRSMTNVVHPETEGAHRPVRPSNMRNNSGRVTNSLINAQNANVSDADSLHTPYFHTDERSSSRSRASVAFRDENRERSRSRSVMTPHLARGDTYKNTHEETPSAYELPAGLEVAETEGELDDRRSRQSKPTLGDSIAAAEATDLSVPDTESVTREPSLVTSGDYKNFNVDARSSVLQGSNLYSLRSESSTNYLRSISRSRSRKPVSDLGGQVPVNEKNDANPQVLEREGALVSDDPYSQVDDLDNMMKRVLQSSAEKSVQQQKNLVNDVSAKPKSTETMEQLNSSAVAGSKAEEDEGELNSPQDERLTENLQLVVVDDVSAEEKDFETHEQLIADNAPAVSAKDIHTDGEMSVERKQSVVYPEETRPTVVAEWGAVNDVSAEEKDAETHEQLMAKEAPTVSACDIHTNNSMAKPEPTNEVHTLEAETLGTGDLDATQLKEAEPIAEENVPDCSESDLSAKEADSEMKQDALQSNDCPGEKEAEVSEGEIAEPVSSVKEAASEAPDARIEVAEQSSNLITEPDTIATLNCAEVAKEPAQEEEEFEVSADELRNHLESLPIYLYTSLAGGMQIITRTNRLTTILQANGIKFEYRDLGTDEDAKKLWRRYAQGKTLPGVVRGDDFIGNWEFIEEVNEDYRLKEVLHETL